MYWFISAWLSLVGYRNNHTVPLCLGTIMKLLYHPAISSTPSGATMCCSCYLPNSFKLVLGRHILHILGVLGMICIIFNLLEEYAFKASNSCKYITILLVYFDGVFALAPLSASYLALFAC